MVAVVSCVPIVPGFLCMIWLIDIRPGEFWECQNMAASINNTTIKFTCLCWWLPSIGGWGCDNGDEDELTVIERSEPRHYVVLSTSGRTVNKDCHVGCRITWSGCSLCCRVFWTVNFVITNWQTMADLEVGGMPKLDVCGDPTTMGTRWEKWLWALKLYLAANRVADDKQQTAVMLHSVGMALQDKFCSLVTQTEADKKTFAESADIRDKHFTLVVNVTFERHLFRQLLLSPSEGS